MAKLFPTKKNYTGLSALILQNIVSDFQVRLIFVNIWNLKKKNMFSKKVLKVLQNSFFLKQFCHLHLV